jgi:lauroyl/myristoyl acyltransferase
VSDRRSFDLGSVVLARLAARQPRLAFALASQLGAMRHRLTRRWPAVDEVRTLFPHLGRAEAGKVATQIAALFERNHTLVRCIRRHGIEPVRPLVTLDPSVETSGPRILALFHVGALPAVRAALERFPTPVLAFRAGTRFTPSGALQAQSTDGEEQERAAVLHRGLEHLRSGGIVALAPDVASGAAIGVPCLGQTLRLAPGAFALARWSGAPIVPTVARWTKRGIIVECGDPVSTPAGAAAWLERYLLAAPSELSLGLLRFLLSIS